jgi:hypothetical protein
MPERGRRKKSWNLLRNLSQLPSLPWCVFGDFNDILSSEEKKGRSERAPSLIRGFRQAVLDAGSIDLNMSGYEFTWFKSLGTTRAVEEKLDRALVSSNWCNLFPNATLECLTASSSDHYPIWLTCKPQINPQRSTHRFKFENVWLAESDFSNLVRQQWRSYNDSSITQKLSNCANDLVQWSRNNNKLQHDISQARKQLDLIRTNVTASNLNQYSALRKRLDRLLVQDDLYWKQRAKTIWYRDGDLNTKFFHAATTSRRKINRIEHLEDSNGTVCRKEEHFQSIARDYFSHLFTKLPSSSDTVISKINASITVEDNLYLTDAFTFEEFRLAAFSMQADKCPGPDGFNPGFYHHFWDM